MNSTTILHNLSPEDIANRFQKLEDLIKNISINMGKKEIFEFVTREEVSEILKCDLSTVHNWTKKGYLKKYAMGDGKTLYRLQEVLDAPKHIPSFNKRKK
jgi:hypothetical protein